MENREKKNYNIKSIILKRTNFIVQMVMIDPIARQTPNTVENTKNTLKIFSPIVGGFETFISSIFTR